MLTHSGVTGQMFFGTEMTSWSIYPEDRQQVLLRLGNERGVDVRAGAEVAGARVAHRRRDAVPRLWPRRRRHALARHQQDLQRERGEE